MKKQILQYIEQYSKEAQITIEYVVLEPFLNAKGDTIYNLHVVYSPKKEYLLRSYLSGSMLEGITERTTDGPGAHGLLTSFPLQNGIAAYSIVPTFGEYITQFTFSNIARFYNFQFNSPTDPFLSMFLETENIVYISEDFKTFFLDKKSVFRPHALHMLEAMQLAFQDLIKKSGDYNYYSDKAKLGKLLQELHKAMKLYFIALRYYNNGELISSFEEKYSLILNTLAQAAKPWEFVQECISFINTVKQKEYANDVVNYHQRIKAESERALLKQECYAFLNRRLIGELDAERNSNS